MSATADRDLLLVQEDALLVETVARRGDLSAFRDEPLAALLGALAADVDEGDMAPPTRYAPIVVPATSSHSPRSRPRHHTGVVALTVAAVLVGSSGVAAAVTGDPLAAIKGAAHLVTGPANGPKADEPSDGQGLGRDGSLPDPAAAEAVLNRSLNQVGRLIARGDLDEARALLVAATAQLASLGNDVAPGMEQRLEAIADRIDRAEGASKDKSDGSKDKSDGSKASRTGRRTSRTGRRTSRTGRRTSRTGRRTRRSRGHRTRRPRPVPRRRARGRPRGPRPDKQRDLGAPGDQSRESGSDSGPDQA